MHSAAGFVFVAAAAGAVPSSWGKARAWPPLGGRGPALVGRERLRHGGGGGGRVVLCPPLRGGGPRHSPTNNLKTHCEDDENERAYLLEEWDHDANDDKKPEDFTRGSTVKVWWRCRTCGCEWDATIVNRTKSKKPTGCPACSGRDRRGEGAGYVVKDLLLCAASGDLDPGNAGWREREMTVVRGQRADDENLTNVSS